MQAFEPTNGHLFCRKVERASETMSGLMLAADSKSLELPKQAYVINSADDRYTKGDVVVYKSYAAYEVEIDRESYIVIPAEDILGKLHPVAKHKLKQAREELDQIKQASTVQL